MTWVLISGLVLMAVALALRHRLPPRGRAVLAAGGVVMLAVALLALIREAGGREEPATITFEEAAGEMLAGEAVSRLAPGDTVLLLRYPAAKVNSREITYRRARSFEKAAGRAGLKVIHGGPDPLGAGVSEDDFTLFDHTRLTVEVNAWCAQHPEVKAVACLLHSLPADLPSANKTPPWFGFDAGRDLVSARMGGNSPLKAVVLYGPGPQKFDPPPPHADARTLFDKRFELVTQP